MPAPTAHRKPTYTKTSRDNPKPEKEYEGLYRKDETMKPRTIFSFLFSVLLLFMSGCATFESAKHKYIMRGQILEVTGDTAYLCIGSKDGAQVGQEYTVYRFVKVPLVKTRGTVNYVFKREQAGGIKITEIVDEHMATAQITRGEVKANYIVELEQ